MLKRIPPPTGQGGPVPPGDGVDGLRELTARALIVVGGFSLLRVTVGLVSQVAILGLLGAQTLGEMALVLVGQGYLCLAADLWPRDWLLAVQGSPERVRRARDTAFTWMLAVGVLTWVAGLAVARPVMTALGYPHLTPCLQVSMMVVFLIPFDVCKVPLFRRMRFEQVALPETLGLTVAPVAKLVLAAHGFGIWSLVWGELFRQALETSMLWWRTALRPRMGMDPVLLREMLSFGWPISLSGVIAKLVRPLDTLLVGTLLGPAEVGYYSLAQRVAHVAASVPEYFSNVWYAAFVNLDGPLALARAAVGLARHTLLALGLPLVVAVGTAQSLVDLLFGPGWAPTATPLKILMAAVVVDALARCTTPVLKRVHCTRALVAVGITSVLVIGPIGLLATLHLGIQGTAMALLLTAVVVLLMQTRATARALGRLAVDTPPGHRSRPIDPLASRGLVLEGIAGPAAAVAGALLVGLGCSIIDGTGSWASLALRAISLPLAYVMLVVTLVPGYFADLSRLLTVVVRGPLEVEPIADGAASAR